MDDNGQAKPTVLAPQQAVQEYLNALLQDATEKAAAVQDVVAVPAAERRLQQVAEVAVLEAVPIPEVSVHAAPAFPETSAAGADPVVAVESSDPSPAEALDAWIDGRPPWAQQRFECLLFKVAGLTLAVPLVELGGVLVIDQELTPLFGQPDWFLGLLPSKTEGTVKVIDTARWVMPERCGEQSIGDLKYVVMMAGSEWGLACHEVADAITLEPHQVNWRSDRGRRPWLAGTVIEHMCAIMDVAALVRLVSKQSRPEHRPT